MHSRNLLKLLSLTVLTAIGAMAVSASTAQAKYLLLLNGASVISYNLNLTQIGSGSITALNGLKIECKEGTGTATATLSGFAEKITGSASATLKGCVWVGSEKTCTINDGGEGLIKIKGNGEIIMEGTSYLISSTGSFQGFTTILTEGSFCTIPEEEWISGTAHAIIENALADVTSKKIKFLNLNLALGNSSVTSLNATASVTLPNTLATFGTHLVNLTGCTPIC